MSGTKHPRKPKRAIQISRSDHRGIVSVRNAPSLKQALTEFWKDTLEPRGNKKPVYVGNTLTVKNKLGDEVMYVANESK